MTPATSASSSELSLLEEIMATHTLHLAPKHLGNIATGIKETLSSMLLHWHTGLKAVPIVYTKADWSSSSTGEGPQSAAILFDNPCVHVQVRVRWLALTPRAGTRATGVVASQGPEHLSLLLLNYFSVTIQASQLGSQYEWDERGAAWVARGTGHALSAGDRVDFEILGCSPTSDSAVLMILGSVDKLHFPKDIKSKACKESVAHAEWILKQIKAQLKGSIRRILYFILTG